MAAEKPCDRTDQHDAHGWGDPRNYVCWGIVREHILTYQGECVTCDITGRDFDCCTPTGPDCRDSKHPACDGRALDEHTDNITACTCSCHSQDGAA